MLNIWATTMNPLFTLQTFDWVTTNLFSTDAAGINLCSHPLFTGKNLHTPHLHAEPSLLMLPSLLTLPHYLFNWSNTQNKMLCIQQLQQKTIPTIPHNKALNTEPWWTPTWPKKENLSDNSPSTEKVILQSLYNDMIHWTKHSETSFFLKA